MRSLDIADTLVKLKKLYQFAIAFLDSPVRWIESNKMVFISGVFEML